MTSLITAIKLQPGEFVLAEEIKIFIVLRATDWLTSMDYKPDSRRKSLWRLSTFLQASTSSAFWKSDVRKTADRRSPSRRPKRLPRSAFDDPLLQKAQYY